MTGPWEVTWDIPGATSPEDVRAVPVVLPPQKVQTHNGLSLRIAEVVQTDRLTAVTVGLVDPPPDVALDRLLSGNPMTRQSELYMEDDRGRRYEPDWRIGWLPRRVESLGSTSATISERMESTTIFEPLQPLARRATMQAPAVQITRRGSGHFDVSVPDGVPLSIQSEFGPASEPWDVDIWVDVAGYTIHFTQARLETMNGTVLVLTSDNVDAQADGRYLSGLRFASITAPDGRSVSLDSAFGDAGAFYQGDSHLIAVLYFGAVNPTTHTVQPGQYHVELAGVAEIVEGPWLLNWRVGPVE